MLVALVLAIFCFHSAFRSCLAHGRSIPAGNKSVTIDWLTTLAAVWRPRREALRPVRQLDDVGFDDLLGIDAQKSAFRDNLELFIAGSRANNVLLWGARGTGKSSLVKCALNAYAECGLRIVEVDKDDLSDLTEIVDDLRDLPQRFLVFCDDLSFDEGETGFKHLKSVLEGSIELPPSNVLLCATSNRRHLVSEQATDNEGVEIVDGELHYGDRIEEKLSLADRFGLWLSFYPNTMAQYLAIVDALFDQRVAGFEDIDRQALHRAAKQFAMTRASRSGRTARQFFVQYRGG